MTHHDSFDLPSPSAHSAVGTGLVALDIVIASTAGGQVGAWAGGTCGNVLTILAYLGWNSYPLARLSDDSTSRAIREDMHRWGVRLDFVRTESHGSTPVIIQQIRRSSSGEAVHSFSCRCPLCGSYLPGYKPLLAKTAAELLPELPSPKIFFFDRTSRGALQLAQYFGQRGALVIYEPAGVGDPALFREALMLAHVVKYSHERMRDVVDLETTRAPHLIIETRGQDGLRFRTQLSGRRLHTWTELKAFRVKEVQDAAGAGDWCTAGLIHHLGTAGLEGFLRTDSSQLLDAFRFGQALAGWNCGFEGARGGMYRVTPRQFHSAINRILDGADPSSVTKRSSRANSPAPGFTCVSCHNSRPL
jgi:sugar/nucleoside kinase (ribokinase family)